ncbi:hypothetical protein ACVW19_005952 [Streptomyces sp. TE5632]
MCGCAGHSHTWPHRVLKNLYGPVGGMFGKFYAGEEEVTAAGGRIPAAPARLAVDWIGDAPLWRSLALARRPEGSGSRGTSRPEGLPRD